MDFFLQQDKARSKTGLLVILFILAVALVVIAVYAAVMVVFLYGSTEPKPGFFDPGLFLTIAGVTIAVIFLGSLFKTAALSKGGGYVAEALGGRPVDRASTDPDEQKLLNVVEEMAIAAGTPVPPVYLLDQEDGINAFAAGFSPSDAVIGVTRGCCRRLSRNELQGVVAHEFSHILNGDMRLNIRLMGLLGGVMVIATLGWTILRSASGHRVHRSRKSGKDGGGQILILAILLLIIGYAGVLIGRIIQSAVSRQREYLADASAVQFTRSTGIADALKKIGGLSSGSKIKAPAAGEACHLFFGQAVQSLFATHPPLIDRIQKIEPGFSGDFAETAGRKPSGTAPDAGLHPVSSFQPGQDVSLDAGQAIERVGNITPENVARSAALLAAIPDAVKGETRDMLGAYATVCALLLDRDTEERKKQLDMLGPSAPSGLLRRMEVAYGRLRDISPELRLPMLDMAIPALRRMSPEQFTAFKQHVRILIEADNKITLFEFCLNEILNHRLEAALVKAAPAILYKNITPLKEDAAALLAILARAGHSDGDTAEQAFRAAVDVLPVRGKEMAMPDKVSFRSLHTALERFSRASPGVKKAVFEACCRSVLFDGRASIGEAELLRAVAYAMDIPAPPFINNP